MEAALPFGDDVVRSLAGALDGMGLELCHVAWRRGRKPVLTLFVDRPGGVSLDDCAFASEAASEVLDRVDSLPSYTLEVSSPGLDRPLWTLGDCERFSGRRVDVRLGARIEGRGRVRGTLERVEGDALTVLDDETGHRYTVRFGDVRVARLVPEI